jgi:hypothetical protein
MNVKKIEKLIIGLADLMKEDALNDEEYLVFVANLLISFGNSDKSLLERYPDLDLNNAFAIELELTKNPNDPYLASILQGHILIKWSESLKNE